MRDETVDVEEAKCDWVRVPIPGVFSSYSQKQRVFDNPNYVFATESALTSRRDPAESPVSPVFYGVISTLSIMFVASAIVNVTYWRKIRSHTSEVATH
jgi:hypothetical protein